MRKLLNSPWVVALLAVAAVIFVAQSLLSHRTPAHRTSEEYAAALDTSEEMIDDGAIAASAAATLADAIRELPLPEPLPDPFAPRRPRTEDTDQLERLPDITETVHLSAIWQQEGERLAFVNGKIVHAGESVGRITLETFERDGVWLTHWKGRDFLRLGQQFTLITPAAHAAISETAQDER